MGGDFYFLFAKVAALVLTPGVLFISALVLGFALLFARAGALWGRRLIGMALFCYVAVAVFPLGPWAVRVLEDRFPARPPIAEPVTGIIVLGGSFDTTTTRERGQVSLLANAERLTEFIRLARLYPDAKLVFSGGSGKVFDVKPTEAEVARVFFADVGFDAARVQFEDRSRNTAENARFGFAQFAPQPGETWLLITSARHMPRAVGLYRHAGWTVVPQPVDYLTLPGQAANFWPRWPGRLDYADKAAYEWGGLLVAWLRGDTDTLFPAPTLVPAPN